MADSAYIGGVLNLAGGIPGQAWEFSGPASPKHVCYILKFTSTYEAIEKVILPPPLKVDRTRPPEVIVWYFNGSGSKGPGGQICDYQGFQFRGFTEHNGVKGVAGWEFVDSAIGDKTQMDIMGPWGVQFGMLKKMADIRFLPAGGNQFLITVTRHQKQVIKMTVELGDEILGQDFQDLQGGPGNPLSLDTLTVREVPSADWKTYLDRSVLYTPTSKSFRFLRAWQGNNASIEFASLDMDPLAELQPIKIDGALIAETETMKETFTNMGVLEKLA
ncbi:hypothetical protein EDB80DRAFT_682064 [Ilyonectria destructans]|nr:hypothetical protein EDB80DRAFT_682064 [Ilyonectria destructans]